MKRVKERCRTEGCENDAASLGLCRSCYAFCKYWEGRTVREKMARLDKLAFWSNRANQVFLPDKLKTVVRSKKVAVKTGG